MKSENTIFTRHTERADRSMGYSPEDAEKISERYPSITKKGERKAREMADHKFGEIVDSMDKDGILFVGGSSEEKRTKATTEVIGDELSNKYQEDGSINIFTKKDIDNWRNEVKEKGGKVLDKIRQAIEGNPDQKLVFTYPLFLKEFSLRPHHRDKDTGEHTPYMKRLLKQVGNNENKAVLEWFRNEGKLVSGDKIFQVPSPQQTAEKHLLGIQRLKEFAQSMISQRSVSIGFVGHGWQLDALAVYLANNGKVNAKAFERLFGSEPIQQPESGKVVVKGNRVTFSYRGKEYQVSEEIFSGK